MRFLQDYDRTAAVMYAHQWAYGRNPAYYDYEKLGGDCTNFASQCIFAGSGIMNFTPTFGWYYIDANQKAPAWTGVMYPKGLFRRAGRGAMPSGGPAPRRYRTALLQRYRLSALAGGGICRRGAYAGKHPGGRPQLRRRQPSAVYLRVPGYPVSAYYRYCAAVA